MILDLFVQLTTEEKQDTIAGMSPEEIRNGLSHDLLMEALRMVVAQGLPTSEKYQHQAFVLKNKKLFDCGINCGIIKEPVHWELVNIERAT